MPDLLTMYAAAHPDKPGVIEDGNVVTYATFEARANQVAGALQQLGIKAGTKLVWCAENSTEVVLVVNAARKAGAVAVPLNYRLSSEEAAYVIDNSDATVVLFDGAAPASPPGAARPATTASPASSAAPRKRTS